MKMKLFFRISVIALCISMSLSSFAEDQQDRNRISVEEIDWSANNQSLESIVSTSDAPTITYLYAATPKKFVTLGAAMEHSLSWQKWV